jgi:hypothetical protein
VINVIAVWNTRYFEQAEVKLARHIFLCQEVWQHLSPFQWSHIHLNGSYHFTGLALKDDFRPLREYQGPRAYLSPGSGSSETEATVSREEKKASLPLQLTFLAEEEQE